MKISQHAQIVLIVAEVFVISFMNYEILNYFPIELTRYISLDVLFCLPVIEAAHLTSIRANRRYDTQIPTFVGIAVALVWSAVEVVIFWPAIPMTVFALNTFTRSVIYTVIGRILIKLWREREYARKDMLTGLANRVELLDRLEAAQSRSERSARPYSLLYFDIDNFKALNDNQGHQVGDEALKMLSSILRECSRKVDVAARLGGDEFVLLLLDTEEQACELMINRIEAATRKAFEERSWPISVSIGRISLIGKTRELDLPIRLADENMYETKKTKQRNKRDQIFND